MHVGAMSHTGISNTRNCHKKLYSWLYCPSQHQPDIPPGHKPESTRLVLYIEHVWSGNHQYAPTAHFQMKTPKPFSEAAASFCCVPQVFGGEPSLQPPLVPLPVKPGHLAATYSTDVFTTASSKGNQGGCSQSVRAHSCSAGLLRRVFSNRSKVYPGLQRLVFKHQLR